MEKNLFNEFLERKISEYREYESLFPRFMELAKSKREDLSDGVFSIYHDPCDGDTFLLSHEFDVWWIEMPIEALRKGKDSRLRYVSQE